MRKGGVEITVRFSLFLSCPHVRQIPGAQDEFFAFTPMHGSDDAQSTRGMGLRTGLVLDLSWTCLPLSFPLSVLGF